jgi:hypothetical protein
VSAADRSGLPGYDIRPETARRLTTTLAALGLRTPAADTQAMPFMLLERPPCFLRQELLGSEAVYEVLDEDDELVTAEVVSVPGLPRGMRVRILAKAAQAMARTDQLGPLADALPPPASDEPALARVRVGAR